MPVCVGLKFNLDIMKIDTKRSSAVDASQKLKLLFQSSEKPPSASAPPTPPASPPPNAITTDTPARCKVCQRKIYRPRPGARTRAQWLTCRCPPYRYFHSIRLKTATTLAERPNELKLRVFPVLEAPPDIHYATAYDL